MKVKSIKINKLYDDVSLDLKFDEKVNIIAGINGAYKSTLLRILTKLLKLDGLRTSYTLREATVELSSNSVIRYKLFKDTLLKLHESKDVDPLLSNLHSQMAADIEGMSHDMLAERELAADVLSWDHKDNKGKIGKISKEVFVDAVNCVYISTFDSPEEREPHDSGITYLEHILKQLEEKYAYYLAEISRVVLETIDPNVSFSKVIDENFFYHKKFIDIVNDAFSCTGKFINSGTSKLTFGFKGKDKNKVIDTKRLSAGEKQFLLIMLTVLLEENKEMILVMDEPEISLHFEWQQNLIKNILSLNPNCQIILATHSPAIIMDGWSEFVINMDEIKG